MIHIGSLNLKSLCCVSHQILSTCNTEKVGAAISSCYHLPCSALVLQLGKDFECLKEMFALVLCLQWASELVTMYAASWWELLSLKIVHGRWQGFFTFINSFSFVYPSNNQGPSGACFVGSRAKLLALLWFSHKFPSSGMCDQYPNIPNTAFSKSSGCYAVHIIS